MTNLSPKQWATVKRRWERYESFAAIAKDYQCNEATLRRRAKKETWQRDETFDVQPLPSKEITPLEKPHHGPAITQKPLDEIGKDVRSRLATNIATTLERVSSLSPDDMREEVQLETVLGSLTKRAATVFGWTEQQSNVLVSVGLLGALPDREVDVTPLREQSAE